jgi:hypothetical protein
VQVVVVNRNFLIISLLRLIFAGLHKAASAAVSVGKYPKQMPQSLASRLCRLTCGSDFR